MGALREVKMAIFVTIFEPELLMVMSPKKNITTDGWMEALHDCVLVRMLSWLCGCVVAWL